MTLRNIMKSALWRLGYDVCERRYSTRSENLMALLIGESNPDLVVDVGANEGQFGVGLLSRFPRLDLVSFEPLKEAHAVLTEQAARFSNWAVHGPVAVGASSGRVTINEAGNSASSSILQMTDLHESVAPISKYVKSYEVDKEPLDILLAEHFLNRRKMYLKIDVQGSESDVLDGATSTLENVVAIQIEMSFSELYEGQKLAPEMMHRILGMGFLPVGFSSGLFDKSRGVMLQMDGYFKRV